MWEPDRLNPCSDSDNVPVLLQVSQLSETVARLHESISAGQGALAPAVDRVSALRTRLELELQQIHLHSQSPDSLAQCLGRLVSAHSVFVSNVEAPYLPLPPPMIGPSPFWVGKRFCRTPFGAYLLRSRDPRPGERIPIN